jgi:lysophospholipase L1-like esterase
MTVSAATEATRSWEQYLRESAVPRRVIDDFIQRPNWATFDPELGYTLHDCLIPWGVGDSRAIESFRPDGARSRFLYADRKPRINSYGDSYTECTQVSDGETWQEQLAAHLGEPIGNFGVGGYGVYQAYRRMLRVEQTAAGAPYVILYVWGEDPVRSLMRCRWAAFYPSVTPADHDMRLFCCNPWPHLEIDLETGSFTEAENPLPTPESLYAMCDPQWMLDHLRDDLALQLAVYAGDPGYGQPGRISELDRPKTERLAELLDFPLDWGAGTDQQRQAAELLHRYGQRATTWILSKAHAFTQGAGKTLLVALNCTARTDHFPGSAAPWGGARRDQEIIEHLAASGIPLFDMNDVHQREHEQAGGAHHEYLGQYLNGGHYNPRGNHLFAYAIKDTLVELLDPKPLPYQGGH